MKVGNKVNFCHDRHVLPLLEILGSALRFRRENNRDPLAPDAQGDYHCYERRAANSRNDSESVRGTHETEHVV